MSNRAHLGAALCCVLATSLATPAHADGEILLTHAKANAGNVTPGDAPGYPITISIPGSFQLASNLFTAANKITIQVTSPNVTIDLNGFTLQGSNVAWYGITGGVDNVTIRNGTITGFKFDGINGTDQNWLIERMRVENNNRNGIVCNDYCLIQDSIVTGNQIGILMSTGAVLGSVIGGNSNYGISGLFVGIGNNILLSNFGASDEVSAGVEPMHPNLCGDCP